MRDILFRGKRKDNGYFVYGYYGEFHNRPLIPGENSCQIFEVCENCHMFGSMIGGFWREVERETVGQFSGWTDKKDQKIFEGDIVELESHGYIPTLERGVVVFKDGCFGIEYQSAVARKFGWDKTFHRIGTISEWRDMGASGTITYTYEVIGNIYDNPELLEKGANNAD